MMTYYVNDPWGPDQLRLAEVADPVVGPGQVLVRMRAAALNFRDVMVVNGVYGGPPSGEPVVPLSDACAVVEATGEGVTRFVPGDRVAPLFFQGWLDGPSSREKSSTILGVANPGVARELGVFAETGLIAVPDFLSDREVATLPCAGVTAWRALFDSAGPMPGATVLILGTGGVSIFGLQFAHAAGARVIVTSSSEEKLERARRLGADHCINYRATPEWSEPVRAATDGRGVDVVLEVGGSGTIEQSIRSVRPGGLIAVIGARADGGPGINPAAMLGTHARLQVMSVGSKENFEDMLRAIDLHRIHPVVDRVYPWTEVRAGLAALEAGEHFGKIVLEFPGGAARD